MMELKPKQVRVKNLYSAVTASDVAAVTGSPKVGKSGDVFSGVVESVESEVRVRIARVINPLILVPDLARTQVETRL